MPADGRILRQHGTLRLVALRAGATAERSVLVQDGRVIAGGFPSLAAAVARFERRQRAAIGPAVQGQAEAPAPAAPTAAAAHSAPAAETGEADNVVSLEEYRRHRLR